MQAEVVNLYKDPSYDVYIGRAGKGKDGYWGNPHSGPDKEANIKLFRTYFYDRIKTDEEFRNKLLQLRGKKLGCFCAPKPCHGDVIVEYLNSLPEVKTIKLAVVGSRTFIDYDYMCQTLKWFDIKQIISGGAKGADALAKRYAEEHNIDYKEFPANWDKHGKSAGYIRNKQIVDAADEVVAFWDGESKGTQHTITITEEQGKPLHVYKPIWKDELAMMG